MFILEIGVSVCAVLGFLLSLFLAIREWMKSRIRIRIISANAFRSDSIGPDLYMGYSLYLVVLNRSSRPLSIESLALLHQSAASSGEMRNEWWFPYLELSACNPSSSHSEAVPFPVFPPASPPYTVQPHAESRIFFEYRTQCGSSLLVAHHAAVDHLRSAQSTSHSSRTSSTASQTVPAVLLNPDHSSAQNSYSVQGLIAASGKRLQVSFSVIPISF